MPIRPLFVTRLYQESLGDTDFVAELEAAAYAIAEEDRAGRAWSKAHGYRGYTSYASLDDLPRRDPAFAELARRLPAHVGRFADACGYQRGGRRPRIDGLWINILKPGGGHSGHIHPHSVVSGTLYLAVPPGAGALKLEDPRLPMMMATPPRREDASEDSRPFIYVDPEPGMILLWESWLRHEVVAGTGKGDRVSISFNYRW
ncbi:TIGR02466 family protein [Sphingomonas sp. 1P06PA]|uniref:TIGR02466 family protein n=1 Tax=Sphingomonas sp. 1P06PA TaxID=554121 RepID=UPI0039A6BD4E